MAAAGRSPVDRGRAGSEHHVLADGGGIPLAISLTGGNRRRCHPAGAPAEQDATLAGASRPTPADRGYDHDEYRRLVRRKGIKPVIARRGTPHGSGLGAQHYVVERTIGLLHWFRRLRIRWEIRDGIHEAFMALAAAIICRRRLVR
ncbi:transposase [Spirillospora sp. NPDC127200]